MLAQIFNAVKQGERLPLPEKFPDGNFPGTFGCTSPWSGYEEYVSLYQECVHDAPNSRPAFREIVAALESILLLARQPAASPVQRQSGHLPGPSVQRSDVNGNQLDSEKQESRHAYHSSDTIPSNSAVAVEPCTSANAVLVMPLAQSDFVSSGTLMRWKGGLYNYY